MSMNKTPSPREVRRFVLLWASFCSLWGVLFLWRHHVVAAEAVWTISAAVGVLGLTVLPLGRVFYRLWMTLAFGINGVVTRFLLAIIFWGVITPLALVFKWRGRDMLGLQRLETPPRTYWHVHDKIGDKSSYRHYF